MEYILTVYTLFLLIILSFEEVYIVSKGLKFFKVTSTLMVIAGCLSILGGVAILAAGLILVARDQNNPGEFFHIIGNFASVGIAISLAGGILQFITGIYSRRNIGNPDKINTFTHLGAIVAFFAITSQVWDILSVGIHQHLNNFIVLFGMVIPAIFIISTIQLKAKEEKHITLEDEFSTFAGFFVKRKEKIFEMLFTLIICGVIGWAFETIEVLFHYGRLTARGMLFISRINGIPFIWGLPFILMYGVGGAILIWCFKPLAKEPIRLFLAGTFVLTLFEYATSVFCEDLLGMKLWDYSHSFMNFQGRVCLVSSLAWGVLSVISVKLLSPLFDKLYNKIMNKHLMHIIIIVLLVYIVVCYILRPILNVEQY